MSYLEAALKPLGYTLQNWEQICYDERIEREEKERILQEKLDKEKSNYNKSNYNKSKSNKSNYNKSNYNKSNKYFKSNTTNKTNNPNSEYKKAFNFSKKIFLEECSITDKDELNTILSNSQYVIDWKKKITFDFSKENDNINISKYMDSKFKFTRSRFFTSYEFKKELIDYYSKVLPDIWIQIVKPKYKQFGLIIFSKRR